MQTSLLPQFICILLLGLSTSLFAQNHCLNLDGMDDFVQVPDFALEDKFTVEFRFKAGSASLVPFEERILSFGPTVRWEIGLVEGDGFTQLWVYDEANFGFIVSPGYDLRDDQWHQIAVVYDGVDISVYIDGSFYGASPYTPTTDPYGPVMRLGAWTGGLGTRTFFNGSIDEVRIWDSALNQKQVIAGLNCQISGDEEDLIAYWDFNQGSAGGNNADELVLIDRTNASRDGELRDFSLTGSSSNWLESPFPDVFCDFVGTDDNLLSRDEVSFSPNPTTGLVTMTGTVEGQQQVQLFNAQGQVLASYNLTVGDELDLQQLPAGCYWIRISNAENYRTQRLIKQ